MHTKPQRVTNITPPLLRMDPDATYLAYAFESVALKMNSRYLYPALSHQPKLSLGFLASLLLLSHCLSVCGS